MVNPFKKTDYCELHFAGFVCVFFLIQLISHLFTAKRRESGFHGIDMVLKPPTVRLCTKPVNN